MKSFSTFFKNGILVVSFVTTLIFQEAQAQATVPVALSLPYTQDFSALAWTSNTYPAGWQGWSLDNTVGSTTSFRTTAPISNLSLIASSDASNGAGGVHNYNGKIGFIPRNNNSITDPSIALAISTSGQSNIKVVFDIMTIRNPYSGGQTHINSVELQYRIGSSVGAFTSLTGAIYSNNTVNQLTGTTPQNLINVTATLPAACENQPVIQLRWVQKDVSGSGTQRPGFAFDNISICGTPFITPSGATTFCDGNSVTLTASSGSSYLWSSGATSQSIVVSSSGNYSVLVTQAGGCSSTSSPTAVTVKTLPDVSVASATVCAGDAGTITASGAVSYLWNTGATTASLTDNPSSTTTYTVTGTGKNGCTKDAQGTITINLLPDVTATSVAICIGAAGTITASGAASYLWNNGTNTAELTESPSATTTYSVTGTDNNGCSNSATGTITVNALPVVVSTSATTCAGSPATITASGAVSYSWNTGATTASISVSPSVTTSYTVTGTDANGCMNNAVGLVSVNSLPVISISSDPVSASVCEGTNITLSGSGADSYSWSGGITNGVAFTPSSSAIYTVTGTDGNGCKNTAAISVTVYHCNPTVVPCGLSYDTKNTYLASTAVAGAVSYRFSFYESPGGNLVSTQTDTTNYVYFSQVSGLRYGHTYYLTVEAGYFLGGDTLFSVPSSSSCPVTFNEPVSTIPCGNSFTTFSSYRACTPVVGAIGYRFNFYDNTGTNLVATKTQSSNYIYFNQVSGLRYGNTYNWTVEVQYYTGSDIVFGPASAAGCPITFDLPQTTVPCGNSFTTLNSYRACTAVAGAVGYRFNFYDNTGSNLVATKTQCSNYIYFNQVSGLRYGNTYNWTVEVQYNTGSDIVFGPPSASACPLTFDPPSTSVACGMTLTSLNTYQACTAVTGAAMYRFTFYSPGTTNVVACKTQTSNYIYFNQVTGLSNNQTYDWSVRIQYFNGSTYVFGPESTPCSITFGTTASKTLVVNSDQGSDDNSDGAENAIERETNTEFRVNMFPNPNNGNFSIEANNDVIIYVYNSLGEKVYEDAMKAGVKQFSLAELSTGIYLVQINNGMTRKQLRLVKE